MAAGHRLAFFMQSAHHFAHATAEGVWKPTAFNLCHNSFTGICAAKNQFVLGGDNRTFRAVEIPCIAMSLPGTDDVVEMQCTHNIRVVFTIDGVNHRANGCLSGNICRRRFHPNRSEASKVTAQVNVMDAVVYDVEIFQFDVPTSRHILKAAIDVHHAIQFANCTAFQQQFNGAMRRRPSRLLINHQCDAGFLADFHHPLRIGEVHRKRFLTENIFTRGRNLFD